MYIEDRGIVFDPAVEGEARRVVSFVDLSKTRRGTLFATFQQGSEKNAADTMVVVCRSVDRGMTWEKLACKFATTIEGSPGSLSSGSIIEVVTGQLMLIATWFDRSDSARPLFDPVTEGILPSKQLKAFSEDEGLTWSDWEEVDCGGLKGCSITGRTLRWPDGTIGFAFESLKEYTDPTPAAHGAWCALSHDGGQTFNAPIAVARDPRHRVFYWDQRLCAGSEVGEIVGLFWTHDLDRKRDLPVHICRRQLFKEGEQLTVPPRSTFITGQIGTPLLLANGCWLAFVVDRNEPGRLQIFQSDDEGVSWRVELPVHSQTEAAKISQGRENIDYAEYWEDMGKWSFGHPAILALDADSVLVSYYAGEPKHTAIHWARIRTD